MNIIVMGHHEPLIFRRRTGHLHVNEDKIYEKEHTEETVKKLKELGITVVRTHFYKGFGLKTEAEEIKKTKKFVKLCHKYDIKVQGYLQFGTFQYETFYLEEPESKNWARINQLGEKVGITYGHQLFRYAPCINKESYIKYLEKVIEMGIKEVKLDMIGFDNVGLVPEPESCHCEICKEKFIEFLNKKYKTNTEEGKKIAEDRFGFSDLRYIEPPNWNRWNSPLTYYKVVDPVLQEWLDFRAEALKNVFERFWKFAKGINPNIILEYNVYPYWGENSIFWSGIDLYRLGKFMDGFYNEHDPHLEITKDKRILSSIRSYKLARAMGNFVIPNNSYKSEKHLKISMAENLAFNQGNIGNLGYILNTEGWPCRKKYIDFRIKNKELYENTYSLAQVGVLESYYSLAYNRVDPYYSNVAIIQSLIASMIPFDIVLDKDLKDLSKYSILILPNIECLSDEQVKDILKYVKGGGNLIITEKTGEYNEWYRKRERNAFSDFMNKIKYIKEIKHKVPYSYKIEDWYIDPKYWNLPENYKEIVNAINDLLKDEKIIDIKAPYGTIVELLGKDDVIILHLINANVNKRIKNIKVSLRVNKKKSKIELISPDEDKTKETEFKVKGNKILFNINSVDTYKVCVIR